MHTSAAAANTRADRAENQDIDPAVLERALHATNNLIVLSDATAPDCPIVWVNDYFCRFTGYDRDEVLGRNCRFLQGEDRDQAARHEIRRAVEAVEPCHTLIRNYKKDGTLFHNDLYINPVHDDDGRLIYFIGVQNDVTEREDAHSEVREREREIDETAENERERFGMDLHDGLGQSLTGIAFLTKALHNRLEKAGSEYADELGKLAGLVDATIAEARQMARGLNPVEASSEGLGDALRTLGQAVEAATGVRVHVLAEDATFQDRREARHLFRIAQEAVNNAAKHAEASEVNVTLNRTGQAIILEVRDNGRGVPAEVLGVPLTGGGEVDAGRAMERPETRAAVARRGMGLYGMRFRAELIGARFSLASGEGGRGTVVRCVLPQEGGQRLALHARSSEHE